MNKPGFYSNEPGKPMPVFFIGHGSPMNGIEENEFSQSWAKLGEEIPTPISKTTSRILETAIIVPAETAVNPNESV